MCESSKLDLQYLSPTWTRSPSGTMSHKWTWIALRCDPSSPCHSRYPTLDRNISISRKTSRSRSRNPSSTRSPTGTRSP